MYARRDGLQWKNDKVLCGWGRCGGPGAGADVARLSNALRATPEERAVAQPARPAVFACVGLRIGENRHAPAVVPAAEGKIDGVRPAVRVAGDAARKVASERREPVRAVRRIEQREPAALVPVHLLECRRAAKFVEAIA